MAVWRLRWRMCARVLGKKEFYLMHSEESYKGEWTHGRGHWIALIWPACKHIQQPGTVYSAAWYSIFSLAVG